jgi:hypothetical protein
MKEDEAKIVLLEYYKQTTEDCRTVGIQKIYIVISLAIMLSTSLYNILNIKNDIKTFSIYNMNSFEIFVISFFIITLLITFWIFLFLSFHLPILDENVRMIEELHREILFGKMRDRYLFCWDNIPGSDDELLKKYLIENFNAKWVKNSIIEKKDNDMTIKLSTGYIFKKSLSLTLNNEKTTVILTINKIVDEFYINNEEKLKVFEPELKYRFRKIYPHLNVYNKSDRLNKIIGLVIFAIILITIILIIFKSKLNYI